MANFKRKTISKSQAVADRLRKARLEKKLTLSNIADSTKIQLKYLEILENGDYQALPGEVYTRTWIRLYAEAVDLPVHTLLQNYNLEKIASKKIGFNKQSAKFNWHSILRPRVLKWLAVGMVVVAFLIYLFWGINNIIAAPQVNITEPANNFRTTASQVMVIGNTQAEVQLKINNEIILLDEAGNFSQNVNLAPGLNNLQISAKKKHSKTNHLELIVLREVVE